MTIAYIGLGSNLGDPKQQLSSAIDALRSVPMTKLLVCSSFYQSKPLGPQGQPDYINAVVKLETQLEALTLLQHMQTIESQHGRTREGERWGPRTLDLDLLVFGEEQINVENLTVPHPEIRNRNFVLQPLVEISPDLSIPGLGLAKDLLARLTGAGLEKIVANEQNNP